MAAAFLLRLWNASLSYLNPDEAWHCLIANANGLRDLYESAIRSSHPPLLIFLLHLVKKVSHHELAVRLLPVVAGAAVAGVSALWLERRFGKPAALFAAVTLAFSPMLVGLGSETRAYSLAMLFMALSLLSLDRALERNSALWTLGFTTALLLAILSEFATLFFAVAAGIYFLIRAAAPDISWRVRGAWAIGQAAALALYGFIYATQISRRWLWAGDSQYFVDWLAEYYPRQGESPYIFFLTGTLSQFSYLIPSLPTAIFGMILFIFGIVALIRRETRESVATALLCAAPFLLVCLAAFARAYPYGMTRQTSFLALFVAGGIAIGLSHFLKRRILPALLLALLFVPLWHLPAFLRWNNIEGSRADRANLRRALEYIRTSIPTGALVLTDSETRLTLGHYLAPRAWRPETGVLPSVERFAGLRFFASRWSFEGPDSLTEDLALVRRRLPAEDGPVWVIDGGFEVTLDRRLSELPTPPAGEPRDFGRALFVFRMPLPAGQ